MTDLSTHRPGHAGPRSMPGTAAPAARHPLARAWRAVERFASSRTADELGALAERYQAAQPGLAARFRSAATATARRA